MSAPSDVKTITCPKCRNKNPSGAAFCGFCGAAMGGTTAAAAPERATMFGYAADYLQASRPRDQAETEPQPLEHVAAQAPQTARSVAAARATLKVGGQYVLGQEGSKVPVGELVLARDSQTEELVDLMLIDSDNFPSPLDIERARRELRQLAKVENGCVLRVLDHGTHDDGRLYVVTERAVGETLKDRVAKGPLQLNEALRVLKDVTAGLVAAQSVGVIHRDIAPQNVMIAQDGTAKLRIMSVAPHITAHVYGTVEFISPEQASGRPVDQRSNIYSLGTLLYYMLAGHTPFSGDPERVIEAHQHADLPRLSRTADGSELPVIVQKLIEKALAKGSSRRHLTLRQLLRDIDGIEQSAGTLAATAVESRPPLFDTPLRGSTTVPERSEPASRAQPSAVAASKSVSAAPGTAAPIAQQRPARDPAPKIASTQDPPVIRAVQDGPGEAVSAATANTIMGEMANGARVQLKQTHAPSSVARDDGESKLKTKPAAPQGGFRETMWFFKGEVESAMAEKGEATEGAASSEEELQDLQQLDQKYVDDGSLDPDAAERLSLRTGKTQQMRMAKIPAGNLPGERMRAEDFIGEINRGRRVGIGIGISVLVIAAVAAAWLLLR